MTRVFWNQASMPSGERRGPASLGAAIGGATGFFGGAATPPHTTYLGPSLPATVSDYRVS